MSQATLEQAQRESRNDQDYQNDLLRRENLDREDLRRLERVIHSFGQGKALEAKLEADYIDEIDCPLCHDEYSLFCLWATNEVMLRDKECLCPIDRLREREMIALHHNKKSNLMPGLEEAEARYDEYDNFND